MAFVRRITAVEVTPGSPPSITPLYRAKRKRKVSGFLKPVDKIQRKVFSAVQVLGNELTSRRERSAAKRDNGALRESGSNVMKATEKAMKKLR